jgi:hypothetical protein
MRSFFYTDPFQFIPRLLTAPEQSAPKRIYYIWKPSYNEIKPGKKAQKKQIRSGGRRAICAE